jgi:uncharacterized membrane protein
MAEEILQETGPPVAEPERVLGMTAMAIDFWKWVVGTVIIGLFGLVIGYYKDKNDTAIKQMDVDSKFISAVSGQYKYQTDTNSMHQNESAYLKYISTFIYTPDLVTRVNQRLSDLKGMIVNSKVDSANHVAAKPPVLVDKTVKHKIDSIEAYVPPKNKQQSMNAYVKDYKDILKGTADSALLTKAPESKVLADISIANVNTTPNSLINNYVLAGTPETFWCKRGYYVVFNNELRVGVDDLDATVQTTDVNFKDNKNGKNIPYQVTNTATLSRNNSITVDYNETRYQVTLNYIAGAGLNPFKKAAYITVAVYKKN